MHFKTVRQTRIRNGPKWAISTSGGLGLLQMILELDISSVPARTLAPKAMNCEISYWLERRTKHS